MTIPKTIHFTAKSKKLSRFAQRTWNAWAKSHPDWEMKLWDDADIRGLVAEHYPQHLAVFDGYPKGIFRADAFRFFVLHKFGGVYADLDVMPLQRIDALCAQSDCFVGAEPELHVLENDARYRGMPFLLCNAFMGSRPGHAFWELCMRGMKRCSVTEDVVDATGPRFVNGIALCAGKDQRPDVLLPNVWSPITGWGRPSTSSEGYAERIAAHFRILGRGEDALVSHLWRNSWFMPVYYKGPQFWRIPNKIHWWWRAKSNPRLANTHFQSPAATYDDQLLGPIGEDPIYIGVKINSADERIVSLISELARQSRRFSVGLFGKDADAIAKISNNSVIQNCDIELVHTNETGGRLHNEILDRSRGRGHCLIADDRITMWPEDIVGTMLSARRPIVVTEVMYADDESLNNETMLYGKGIFKALYRARAHEKADVIRLNSTRAAMPLHDLRYLNIAPVTTIGADLVLIREEVVAAGVRFPETPYKLHRDAQGFAILARDMGFEVAALPNHTVVTRRAPLP
ncbi:hypothetical protein EMQ25_03400 [Arsenicitalea aurantiaca]|uniref:Glycosyl transferase n=1 Tax=Arsenicitalea aurantiaca TaxID=1783274 RepID=A0A433XLQ3_9HYPH|nr:glycosyltransferase [Arsenicitalea aurantiaca]RUT35012.1 hypothetical protein EMQ25_03400 [Arsenicitalea aurantiaca]